METRPVTATSPAAQPAPDPAKSFATPFDAVGGNDVVRAIVNRFYDLVETDPAYAELHAMHARDLSAVRHGLERFLVGWLGGPRDWFDRGTCVMSLHRRFPITPAIAGQWADAMNRAIEAQPDINPRIADLMAEKLGHMARAMINLGVTAAAAE